MSEPTSVRLDETECWQLLGDSGYGRMALSVMGEPDIFPINFLVRDREVLLRTGQGTKLTEIAINHRVALEADAMEERSAWSVVVKGELRIVDTFTEGNELDEAHLRSFTATDLKPVYLILTPTEITGRRFFKRDSEAA